MSNFNNPFKFILYGLSIIAFFFFFYVSVSYATWFKCEPWTAVSGDQMASKCSGTKRVYDPASLGDSSVPTCKYSSGSTSTFKNCCEAKAQAYYSSPNPQYACYFSQTGDITGQYQCCYSPPLTPTPTPTRTPTPTSGASTPTPTPSAINSISGNILDDVNGNGIIDAGETANYTDTITITVKNTTTNITYSATNSSGNYSSNNLPAGPYTVTFGGLPGDKDLTLPSASTSPQYSFNVTVGPAGTCRTGGSGASCSNGNIINLKAGVAPAYSISGNIFNDVNGDKLSTGDSNYIGPITITVKNTAGTPYTVTNTGGVYFSDSLPPGEYTVTYELPVGRNFTYPPSPYSFTVTVGPPGTCRTGGYPGVTCYNGDISNLNAGVDPLYSISGKVFDDVNGDGSSAGGDPNYTDPTITITVKDSAGNDKGVTNVGGEYSSDNLPAGPYTVTFGGLPGDKSFTYPSGPPYSLTVTVGASCSVSSPEASCSNGDIRLLNVGVATTYSILGIIFNDVNGDKAKNAEETNYTGTISISISPASGSYSSPVGSGDYSFTNLPAGQYTITYGGLPPGREFTYPPASSIPPYSITVRVGAGDCSAPLGKGSCFNGNISLLNVGVTNDFPWFQSIGADIRWDSGFNNVIPTDKYASLPGTGGMPGIIFSGATTFTGPASQNPFNWKVGSPSNPEVFTDTHNIIPTSYGFLLKAAQSSGITPTTITSPLEGKISAPGIYKVEGNLSIGTTAYTFGPGTGNYIILINGNLDINRKIRVNVGSTAIFSASGNITVNKFIGETTASTACNITTHGGCSIEGLYSADKDFIADGLKDCSDPMSPDKRLNVAGTVIANAGRTGNTFINRRDLCDGNSSNPSVTFTERPDFMLSYPSFVKQTTRAWQEVAP